MEVKLDKRYPIAASIEQCWAVLGDVRTVAACMPGAQITEQLDDTHFKGSVKSKIGPAVMSFSGDIELQGRDEAARSLQLLGKGADKAGSSASMQLAAHLEPGDDGATVLAGVATINVSGKLAQFGNRLLVPVSDAMLAQFADNFRAAAAAVPAVQATTSEPATTQAEASPAQSAVPPPPMSTTAPSPPVRPVQGGPAVPAAPPPKAVKELNALSLMWTVFKDLLAGLFGRNKR
ncbi:MAG TPA: SRPBCC family protein [Rubrivivax sp.]|nr:SRPBCC family protein [Rubrivivax sp.]